MSGIAVGIVEESVHFALESNLAGVVWEVGVIAIGLNHYGIEVLDHILELTLTVVSFALAQL